MAFEIEEEGINSLRHSQLESATRKPAMVKFLMDKHIAKDETVANFILLGIAILFISAALFFSWDLIVGPEVDTRTYDELSPIEQFQIHPEIREILEQQNTNNN